MQLLVRFDEFLLAPLLPHVSYADDSRTFLLTIHMGQNKGVLEIGSNGAVDAFREKSDFDGDLINIGFMVFEPEVFDYIDGDSTVFEKEPMNNLVRDMQLMAYTHKGYWQCMDTLREKQQLEKLWSSGSAPWKLWD